MPSRKLDVPAGLVLAGAALLLVALFLDWFSPDLSGWNAFEALDLVLAAIAIGAAAIAAGRLDRRLPGAVRWLAPLAGLAFVVVAVQLIDPPPVAFEEDREIGAWLALVGTVLMAAGAALTVARVNIVLDVSERERRERRPAVDRREDDTAVRPTVPVTPPAGASPPAESPGEGARPRP